MFFDSVRSRTLSIPIAILVSSSVALGQSGGSAENSQGDAQEFQEFDVIVEDSATVGGESAALANDDALLPAGCRALVPLPETIDACITRLERDSRRNLTRVRARLADCQDNGAALTDRLSVAEKELANCSASRTAPLNCPEVAPLTCDDPPDGASTQVKAELDAAKIALEEETKQNDALTAQAEELSNQLRGANLRLQAAQDQAAELATRIIALEEEKLAASIVSVLARLTCVGPNDKADLENNIPVNIVSNSRETAQQNLAIVSDAALTDRITLFFAELPEGTGCPVAVYEPYAAARWADEAETIAYSFFQTATAQERIDSLPSSDECEDLSFALVGTSDPVWLRAGQELRLCNLATGQVSPGRIRDNDSGILIVKTQKMTP